jgi:DNA replication and repair protein RecF
VWVEKLEITGWRNHAQSSLNFALGTTVLVGPNGQGKTNVVEALAYLATLGSHRVSSTQPLITDGEQAATIYADLRHDQRSVGVGLTLKRKGSSEAQVNGVKAKASDIPHWVSVVMFAPEDTAIVRGEPGDRRAFMDQLVISASPSMAAIYQDFERVIKQRNSLLKSLKLASSRDTSTLSVWNDKFVELATQIIVARQRYLSEVMPLATQNYAQLAADDVLDFRYVPSFFPESEDADLAEPAVVAGLVAEGIASKAKEEIERGISLVGPHRDDVEFMISGKLGRTHASQGETWSLALSLRLGTAQWLRQERASGDPIIVLDDVFSELDKSRRERLVGLVGDYSQLIVTAAVEEDLPTELGGSLVDVKAGVVSPR